MSQGYAYLNGEIVPLQEAKVSITDRGILYGDGLYETIRVRHGNCLRFDQHVERFRHGAAVLKLSSLLGLDLASPIEQVLSANSLADARIRVTVTRGANTIDGGMSTSEDREPTIIITANPLSDSIPVPATVIISSYRRDEHSPLAGVKTLNCLPSVMALAEAHERGADDAIFLNTLGTVAEGTSANVFLVKGDRIVTPSLDQGCLPGTVRSAILELAAQLGFEATERPVDPADLFDADELFFTSAVRLIRPIGSIDGRRGGGGTYDTALRLREALLAEE